MIETLIEYDNGGIIQVQSFVDKQASDFQNIIACCDYFARQGAKTMVMPRFSETIGNPSYEKTYHFLEGTQYWGKCPDFLVNGKWYEHEGYDAAKDLSDPKKKASTFCNMVGRGIKQSNRIVVEDCGVGRNFARRIIFNRILYQHQKHSGS